MMAMGLVFVSGVILWIVATGYKKGEQATRSRDLEARIKANNDMLDAMWKEHDETFMSKIDELYEQGL